LVGVNRTKVIGYEVQNAVFPNAGDEMYSGVAGLVKGEESVAIGASRYPNPVDSRLQQVGEVFGIVGEFYSKSMMDAAAGRLGKREVSAEELAKAGQQLSASSQTFLRELDVRAARDVLREIDSVAGLAAAGSGAVAMTTVTTVTVTVTITVKAVTDVSPAEIGE
jgi:hypothetical protein